MADLSVIAPCLNEADNLPLLFKRTIDVFNSHSIKGELIIIDDGSTDNTARVLDNLSELDSRLRFYSHPGNRGIEASWRTGIGKAASDVVCLIDGDLQNHPEDIIKLYQTFLSNGGDVVVQGVRNPAKGLSIKRPFHFSIGLNQLLNICFKMKAADNKSGFILCRRHTLLDIISHQFKYRYFQCFVGVSAFIKDYKIIEVDTVFGHRQFGTSFLSYFPLFTVGRIIIEVVKYRIELSLYKPKHASKG